MYDIVKVTERIYEVEISGWYFSPRKPLKGALKEIEEKGRTIVSVHKSTALWDYHYLVFTI